MVCGLLFFSMSETESKIVFLKKITYLIGIRGISDPNAMVFLVMGG